MDERDRTDIQESLDGDGDAYARLIDRYQNVVAAMMWRFSRQRSVCEELVQDVFVQAYFSLRSYRADAPFEHWLKTIATRLGYKYWKSQAKDRGTVSLSPEVWQTIAGADDPDPADAAESLHRLLGLLPPRDRLVLTLMYFEQLTVEQISQRTGFSKTLVKVQLHRARKKLKLLLEKRDNRGRNDE